MGEETVNHPLPNNLLGCVTMLAQPFVYFPFLNSLGDMPFMRVKNLEKASDIFSITLYLQRKTYQFASIKGSNCEH